MDQQNGSAKWISKMDQQTDVKMSMKRLKTSLFTSLVNFKCCIIV